MLSSRVFVAVCRGYWDRMAKDVLHFLENRKENMSWVKSASAEMALQVRPCSGSCIKSPFCAAVHSAIAFGSSLEKLLASCCSDGRTRPAIK